MNSPKKLLALENVLNLLLLFVPIAIVLEYFVHPKPIYVFAASALAIIPLAGLMGKATEHLAVKLGEGVGGPLNATFGNATVLIIAILALRAVGSSIQIALFVAPVLIFLSYVIGPSPMDLLFTTLEVVAIALAVAVTALISLDGETNWMEGVQLLAVYLILGVAFYFLPV